MTSAGSLSAEAVANARAWSLIVGVRIVIYFSARLIGLIPPENSFVVGLSTPKS
jgi:hypothetical protein